MVVDVNEDWKMTVEQAIKWTEKGWIVGSNLEGQASWMKWIHGYMDLPNEEI